MKRIGKRGFVLEAVGVRDGKRVVFWRGEPLFDVAGTATLPFWSKTLTLTRSGKDAATVALVDGGDGRGWEELDAPAAVASAGG